MTSYACWKASNKKKKILSKTSNDVRKENKCFRVSTFWHNTVG